MLRIRYGACLVTLGIVVAAGCDSGGGTGHGGSSSSGTTSSSSGALPTASSSTSSGTASASSSSGASSSGSGSSSSGALGTVTPDLFVTIGGKTAAQVDTFVTTAVNRYYGIGGTDPTTPTVDGGYRCYYELPQDPTMGFIWAADSADIRSEGMSYGMMVAVQMNLHPQFDKLWKFAKTYMQYPSTTAVTAWKYYFMWQGTVNTASASSWTVTFPANTVPAPDGDQYFAAALYLADKRWGSAGAVNYKQEADNITSAMLHNTATSDSHTPIVDPSQKMVVFVPYGNSATFTDPSYHLPAFYELFAAAGPSADQAAWKAIAAKSRTYLVSAANATTGLHADYATFAGAPTTGSAGDGHDQFKYDAWRVVMNMAVDYAHFSSDAGLKAQVEKYHSFFTAYLGTNNVTQSLFHVDGTTPTGGGSTALTATLAAGCLASSASNCATYVNNLWGVAQQSGQYRYYQEGVYLLGLLNASGKFQFSW